MLPVPPLNTLQLSASVSTVPGVEPLTVNVTGAPTAAISGPLVMLTVGATSPTVMGLAEPVLPFLSVIVSEIWYVPSSSGLKVKA